jgi:hypothetical protein
MFSRSALVLSCLAISAAAACSPSPPSASGALGGLGESSVKVVGGGDTVLVIDWPEANRNALARAIESGTVVVAMQGGSFKLLDDCVAEGKYAFKRLSRQENVTKYSSSDEIKANLPSTGTVIANKLEAGRSNSEGLDIAIITVGVRSSEVRKVPSAGLKGASCAGATHFIRHAYMGAFAFSSGAKSENKTSVELFKMVPVGPNAKKEEGTAGREGDLEACRGESAADKPVPNCDAVIRVTLAKLGE